MPINPSNDSTVFLISSTVSLSGGLPKIKLSVSLPVEKPEYSIKSDTSKPITASKLKDSLKQSDTATDKSIAPVDIISLNESSAVALKTPDSTFLKSLRLKIYIQNLISIETASTTIAAAE